MSCMAALYENERFPRPGFMLRLYARGVRKRILALEAMLRRLFALEAAQHALLARAQRARGPRPGPRGEAVAERRKHRAPDVSAEDSRDWTGVSFVLVPRKHRAQARSERKAARKPERYVDVTRLAIRFEALTRAMANPARYIAKLARRLAVDPPRVAALIKRPRPAGPRVTAAFDSALKAALAGVAAAPDTS